MNERMQLLVVLGGVALMAVTLAAVAIGEVREWLWRRDNADVLEARLGRAIELNGGRRVAA